MPLRPTHLLRSFAYPPHLRPSPPPPPSSPWLHPRQLPRNTPRRRTFHTSPPLHADAATNTNALTNHYQTLDLPPTASSADIKRQFYALSKQHHPDRNQNDPQATTRFVAISEAYHVLSVPEKRAQYDASLSTAHNASWGGSGAWRSGSAGGRGYPQGSYSSASFGARPASGLNKKRSTFRGPPPSFYKAGGYGAFGAKRSEYAYQAEPDRRSAQEKGQEQNDMDSGTESYGEYGGFGPGQQRHGDQVPHFNDKRHKETHDNVYAHIWARRRQQQQMRRTARVAEEDYEKGNLLINFLVMSGVISIIGLTAKLFGDEHEVGHLKKSGERA